MEVRELLPRNRPKCVTVAHICLSLAMRSDGNGGMCVIAYAWGGGRQYAARPTRDARLLSVSAAEQCHLL
jgi:hypothetical protein